MTYNFQMNFCYYLSRSLLLTIDRSIHNLQEKHLLHFHFCHSNDKFLILIFLLVY